MFDPAAGTQHQRAASNGRRRGPQVEKYRKSILSSCLAIGHHCTSSSLSVSEDSAPEPRAYFQEFLASRALEPFGVPGAMFSLASAACVGSMASGQLGNGLRSRKSLRGPLHKCVGSVFTRPATVRVHAAKGRNVRLAGRDKKQQKREDDKMLDNQEAAQMERQQSKKEKRDPNLKYSKRGKVSSQPGQVSKAALKRVREATKAATQTEEIDQEKAEAKRATYLKAQGQGIPQKVTDRMLKRITIFSGIPLLLGFSTGPIFYGLKVFAKADVAPWQFFVASTATFGAALVGITYGVLSASWEPNRENESFWGLEEFKTNIPILMSTITNKANGQDGSSIPDEWDDGEE